MSTPKDNRSGSPGEIKLGSKDDSGEYKYSSRVDFSGDLSTQIANLIREKKIHDELKKQLVKIREVVGRFKEKERNLVYYKSVGVELSFLDDKIFRNVKQGSILRRVHEEVPDISPSEEKPVAHLTMMYKIGGLNEDTLAKANWNQWYEISKFKKFKGVATDEKTLTRILELCKKGGTGPKLRNDLKSLLN